MATLREKNKLSKLRRIRSASKKLFGTKGFDFTTTREIAKEANVGLATLFLYASNKRDLLFLACNEDLESLTNTAFSNIDFSSGFLDQVVGAFRCFFEFYEINRLLSRDLLRELTFYTTGTQSERFQNIRNRTLDFLAALVQRAREEGTIAPPASDFKVAQVLFYVFAAHVRRWLESDEVSVETGVADLHSLLEVVVLGMGKPATKDKP